METHKRLAQISGPKYPDGHPGKAIGKLQQNQFLNSLNIALERSSSYLEYTSVSLVKGQRMSSFTMRYQRKPPPKVRDTSVVAAVILSPGHRLSPAALVT